MTAIAITFDTLLHAKKLQEKGFSQEQAEAQVELFKEVIDNQLVTKSDLDTFMLKVDTKLNELSTKVNELNLKIDSSQNEIKASENRIIVKLGSIIVASISVLGIILAIITRIH